MPSDPFKLKHLKLFSVSSMISNIHFPNFLQCSRSNGSQSSLVMRSYKIFCFLSNAASISRLGSCLLKQIRNLSIDYNLTAWITSWQSVILTTGRCTTFFSYPVRSLRKCFADPVLKVPEHFQTVIFEKSIRGEASWFVRCALIYILGANINQQDRYGRAPLHVAAAVNYTEMIEFLLKQEADIGITTFGELQTPIHFAAKNDACQALKLLINYGASIHIRDYQNRTPLQVICVENKGLFMW